MIEYRYPVVVGKGRYPDNRFRSGFSLKTEVKTSFKTLFEKVANCGSDLVLSYPENGLVPKAEDWLHDHMASYFSEVSTKRKIVYKHSTMGASKGRAQNSVNELIILARV